MLIRYEFVNASTLGSWLCILVNLSACTSIPCFFTSHKKCLHGFVFLPVLDIIHKPKLCSNSSPFFFILRFSSSCFYAIVFHRFFYFSFSFTHQRHSWCFPFLFVLKCFISQFIDLHIFHAFVFIFYLEDFDFFTVTFFL